MNLFNKIIDSLKKNNSVIHSSVIKEPKINEFYYNQLNSNNNENLYQKVYSSKSDALIIHNFITSSEIELLIKNIPSYIQQYPDLIDLKKSGYTIGKTLFETDNLETYKNLANKFQHLEQDLFGFRFTERICSILKIISGVKNVSSASFIDGNNYLSNSVRVFNRNQNGLIMHSDFQVHKVSDESKEIMKKINTQTILSAFVTIQKPERGGRLFLWDCTYENTPVEISKLKDTNYNKIIEYVKQFNVSIIDPPTGSLILFDAGQRWHEIEPIIGSEDRITVGCFNGYSKDNDNIYIWS